MVGVRTICESCLGQTTEIVRQALREILNLPRDYRTIIETEYPSLKLEEDEEEEIEIPAGHNSQLTLESVTVVRLFRLK
jgi:hypothetical protein